MKTMKIARIETDAANILGTHTDSSSGAVSDTTKVKDGLSRNLPAITFRFIFLMVLLAVNPATASAQFPDLGKGIGPSGAQVAGAIAGVAAVTGVVLYLTLHKPSIVGCTQLVDGVSSLTDEKDKHTYILVSNGIDLKTHERLVLKGKKTKERGGTFKFKVHKVARDFGSCN